MAGHVAPEAFVGGPIALIREGEIITFDVVNRRLDVAVDDSEMERRRAVWIQPEPAYKRGVFAKYALQVSSASDGAVTS
jgi:dihydroxy-acid dehydratase